MIDPLSVAVTTAILLAIFTTAIAWTVLMLELTFQIITDWFKRFINLVDSIRIAFTLKKELASGNYGIEQGIFNTKTEKIEANRGIPYKNLDGEMLKIHLEKKLVLWN